MFQQDSAPAHRARERIKLLQRETPECISPDLWPPNSKSIVSPFLTHGVDAHENILSPACLTVFVKSKTENQLMILVTAYLVADNNVKYVKQLLQCETADFITADLWPPHSPDLNTVDYKICGVLQ